MYKCIVHMRPTRVQAMNSPLFVSGFVWCVVSMWVCVMWVYVCVLWCAWHLLYKNTGVTHQFTLCCFILSRLQSQWLISG